MNVFDLSASITLNINEFKKQLSNASKSTDNAISNISKIFSSITVPSIDIPPIDIPPIDVPPIDIPPIDIPPIDVPPIDVPPIDVPSIDVPPIDDEPVTSFSQKVKNAFNNIINTAKSIPANVAEKFKEMNQLAIDKIKSLPSKIATIIKSIPSSISSILKNIGTNISNAFKNGVENAKKALKELPSKAAEVLKETGEKLKNIAETVSKTALAAVGAVSAAVVGFGKTAVDAGMNFDKSISQVAATMGKTVDEISELREFAQEMGQTTAFSATEAADALNYMALAGYDAEKSMNMLPNVLNLASAGGIDLAYASDMITDTQSALGLSIEETTQLVDKMAKASSKSNTSVAQLGEAMLTIGGTAKKLKGGTTELSTVLGIFADNGIKGSEGGTHLRNMMNSLIAPTEEAMKMLDSMGTSLYDSAGNMRSLNDVFIDLRNGMNGLATQAEKDQVLTTIFNARDLKAAEALIANAGDRFNELRGYIEDSEGAAEAMAKTQLDNLAGDVTLFKSALESVQIAVSDQLNPTLRNFVQLATDGLSEISSAFHTGGLDDAIDAVGSFLADFISKILQTIPKVITVASSVITSFGNAITDKLPPILKGILAQISGFARNISENAPAVIRGFSEMLSSVADWIKSNSGLLIPEVTNMIKSITSGIRSSLPDMMSTVTEIIVFIGDTLSENTDLLLDSGLQIISAVINGISRNAPKLINNFSSILKNISVWIKNNGSFLIAAGKVMLTDIMDGISENTGDMAESVTEIISFIIKTITENLPLLLQMSVSLINVIAQGIINNLPLFIDSAFNIISSLIKYISENLPLLVDSALNIITTLAEYISENISDIVPAIVDIILTIAGILTNPDTLSTLIDAAIAIITGLADGIIDSLPELIERLPELVQGIVDGIIENVPKLLKAARKITRKLVGYLLDPENLSSLLVAAADIITSLIKGAVDVLYKLDDLASDILVEISDNLNLEKAWEWGRDLVINFCNGIKDWWTQEGGLEDTLEGFGEEIYDWLHHSTPEKGPLKDDDEWGVDFADNFINGIKSRQNALSKTVGNTADILSDVFSSEPQTITADIEKIKFLNSPEDIISRIKKAFSEPIKINAGVYAEGVLNGFEMPEIPAYTNNIPVISDGSYISEYRNIPDDDYSEKNSPIVVENLYITLEGMNFNSEFERKRFYREIANELHAMNVTEKRGTGGVIF